MAKRVGTDGSLLQSLPWTLFAVAISILPHILYIPFWATAAFAACAIGRLHIERHRKRLPPAWLRLGLALLCFLGVIATYQNIAGVGPGSALLVVMAALKLMETRKRRDQFVLLFISIFLLMSSLLREQYIWSLPYLLFGTAITMTAWLRMSAGPTISIGQSVRSCGRLLLYAAPLTLAMWIFFPRLSSPFWAVPVDTSRAQSGLSNTMSPGDISSLSLSDEVAFRVHFEGETPARRDLYFRGLVLHRFNGSTWTGNDAAMGPRSRWPIEYMGDPVRYQITMEPSRQHWVYALDVPYEWSLENTLMGQQQQLARSRAIDQRVSFDAVSFLHYRLDIDRQARPNDYYLWLPEKSNPQTRALAESMRDHAGNDEQYVEDVLRMFNEQEYYYTLNPPRLGSSPVDQFMFETLRGFCEHYASAFAVMMRAAGIPSRVVLGYQGGEFNSLGDYLIVRQADAHAWNEIWLPNRGWTRMDPTGAVAPERIDTGVSGSMFDEIGASWGLSAPSLLFHRLTLTWDALNAKWNEWVLGYGPDNQNNLMRLLGMDDPDWRKMVLTLLAIVISLVSIISLLLVIRYRPPKKDEAAILFRKFSRRIGIEPKTGESPSDYAARVSKDIGASETRVAEITEQYLLCRYGAPGACEIANLRDAINRFRVG